VLKIQWKDLPSALRDHLFDRKMGTDLFSGARSLEVDMKDVGVGAKRGLTPFAATILISGGATLRPRRT